MAKARNTLVSSLKSRMGDADSVATIAVEVSREQEILVPRSNIETTFTFTPDRRPLRHYYDLEKIKTWAENDLVVNGIRSPLWLRPHPFKSEAFELVAGMRRLTGAEMIGLPTLPAKVFNWTDDEAYTAAMSENANREDFTPLEELDHLLMVLSTILHLDPDDVVKLLYRMNNESKGTVKKNPHDDQAEAKEKVLKVFDTYGQINWRTFVTMRLPLIKLKSEVLSAVRNGDITYLIGIEVAKIKDDLKCKELLSEAIENKSSLAEVKKIVRKISKEASQEPPQSVNVDTVKRLKLIQKSLQSQKLSKASINKVDSWIKLIEEELQSSI